MKYYKIILMIIVVMLLIGCTKYEINDVKPEIKLSGAVVKIDEVILKKGVEVVKENEVVKPVIVEEKQDLVLIARKWEFNPKEIKVKLGENVTIRYKTDDVLHGLRIPYFNIVESAVPGREKTIKFKADKKGEYPFYNHIKSGIFYEKMKGKLIVE